MKKERRERVWCFLSELKKVITSGGSFALVERNKNLNALSDLGLTKIGCRDILLGLSIDDYIDGPVEDADRPGDIWVFGKNIGGCEVYIKLKLIDSLMVKCISFHRAEYPLKYPCRK